MKKVEQIAGLTYCEAGERIRESYLLLGVAPPEWNGGTYLRTAARRMVWHRAAFRGFVQ